MTTILLITSHEEDHWANHLRSVLTSIAEVTTGFQDNYIGQITTRTFDLIIIDSGTIDDVIGITLTIHMQKPGTRVAIATISPTWQRAREALRAGATGYFLKSLNSEDLLNTIKEILRQQPKEVLSFETETLKNGQSYDPACRQRPRVP